MAASIGKFARHTVIMNLTKKLLFCPLIRYNLGGVTQGIKRLQSTDQGFNDNSPAEKDGFKMEAVEALLKEQQKDMPIQGLSNPYEKPYKKCIFCQYNIDPDYKNTQLLSQFVSTYSGRIYGRHITGLCIPMQKRIAVLIKRARNFGLMPYIYKDVKYLEDPKLFDPFRPQS